MTSRTVSMALLFCAVLALAPVTGAVAADYVPFLPDTTAFAPPFDGQAFRFTTPRTCYELSRGNLEDEAAFDGDFVPTMVMEHVFDRILDVWENLSGYELLPGTKRVAGIATGWSYPDSLTVTFAMVDTAAGGDCVLSLHTERFADEMPVFPDIDPVDTLAIQQVNTFLQFRTDYLAKSAQLTTTRGSSVETTTDPDGRPTGSSIIDIVDVSDKQLVPICPPATLMMRIQNTGTGGLVAYQFDTNMSTLLHIEDIPAAVEEARLGVRARWQELGQAVEANIDAILGFESSKAPCGEHGGLSVSLSQHGSDCSPGQANCVIFGDGNVLGIPPGGTPGLPEADAGEDITAEFTSHSGTPVTLNATGSSDPNELPLTFFWSAPGVVFDDPTSPAPTGAFPLGTTTVMLLASNGRFHTSDNVDITIVDTTPPTITILMDRNFLWPPNHQLSLIGTRVTLSDLADETPSAVLTAITSNEPDSGIDEDDVPGDIQDADIGTLDTLFRLRSERDGEGDGRVYTIVYTAQDDEGNTSTGTTYVYVPHDRSGAARSFAGFNESGTAFLPGAAGFSLVIPGAEGFDPATIDAASVEVGNTMGVIESTSNRLFDADGDGLNDLEVQFPVAAVQELQGGGAHLLLPTSLGLHWANTTGETYLVDDIFALGAPLPPATTGAPDPTELGLYQVHPNPMTSRAQISYAVSNPSGARVEIGIFNVAGQRVRNLVDAFQPAGQHSAMWDGRSDSGELVPGGVYFSRVHVAEKTLVRRMILAR